MRRSTAVLVLVCMLFLVVGTGCGGLGEREKSMPGSTLTMPEAVYWGCYFLSAGLVALGLLGLIKNVKDKD